uniref:Allatotropin n=1 Tax=Bombyx mori TaxID=7091 RepID=A0A8R2LZX2_BOMMO|nr:allatotropin isoform X2 [Bombyx mori]
MNLTMQLAVVVAVCLCLAEGAPDGRLARKQQRPTRGFKNVEMMTARGFGKRDRSHTRAERDVDHQRSSQRPSRGTPTFKSPSVGIARDFGKRTPEFENEEEEIRVTRGTFKPNSNILIARGYGKRTNSQNEPVYGVNNYWDMLENAPEREGQEANDDKTLESIPLDWFVNEVLNNPDFARSVVRKFIDLNQDGMLSSDELLRNY